MISNDSESIDRLTTDLYTAISFAPGEKPDLNRLRGLFLPPGILINNNEDHPVIWDLEEFSETYQRQIDSGAVVSFIEKEIVDRTERFGTIAHRFSTL